MPSKNAQCKSCGKTFELPKQRGRPPVKCEDCRNGKTKAKQDTSREAKSEREWDATMKRIHDDGPATEWLNGPARREAERKLAEGERKRKLDIAEKEWKAKRRGEA